MAVKKHRLGQGALLQSPQRRLWLTRTVMLCVWRCPPRACMSVTWEKSCHHISKSVAETVVHKMMALRVQAAAHPLLAVGCGAGGPYRLTCMSGQVCK